MSPCTVSVLHLALSADLRDGAKNSCGLSLLPNPPNKKLPSTGTPSAYARERKEGRDREKAQCQGQGDRVPRARKGARALVGEGCYLLLLFSGDACAVACLRQGCERGRLGLGEEAEHEKQGTENRQIDRARK